MYLKISNSKVSCQNLIPVFSTNDYYTSTLFEVLAEDSEINASGHVISFKSGRYGVYGSVAMNGYSAIVFKNCEINTPYNIVNLYKESNSNHPVYIRNFIVITGCTINVLGNALYSHYINGLQGLVFTGNKILKLGRVMNCPGTAMLSSSDISISDAIIDTEVVNSVSNVKISLDNVVVGSDLASGSNNIVAKCNNAVIPKISAANCSGDFVNCSVEGLSQSDVVPGYGAKVFKGCTINALGGDVFTSPHGDVILLSCDVTGNIDNGSYGKALVFDSVVNGLPVPFFNRDNRSVKRISPIFRIGGANGSLELSTTDVDEVASASSRDIKAILSAGTIEATVFISGTQSPERMANILSAKISFTDSVGGIQNIYGILEEDQSSQWDGVIQGTNYFKIVFPLTSTGHTVGVDSKATVTVDFFPSILDSKLINIDLDVHSL